MSIYATMGDLQKYHLGAGVEAFSTQREGVACGRIINAIRLI